MRHTFLLFVLVLMSLCLHISAQTIPYSIGRIVISSDGNEHDHDDWAATPFSLAMLAAAGLQDQLKVYTFSDHIWGSNQEHPDATEQMQRSALGGKEQFGFDHTVFIEAVEKPDEAVKAIVDEINRSKKADPLTIIAAGPMEVVGRALSQADAKKLKYVMILSHSKWNDRHADNVRKEWDKHSGWTWDEMDETFTPKGLQCVHIADQNGDDEFDGMRAAKEKFDWLKTSAARDNAAYKPGSWDWLYERQLTCVKNGEFDPSDAGMIIYLLTGKEKTNPEDARAIMENPRTK